VPNGLLEPDPRPALTTSATAAWIFDHVVEQKHLPPVTQEVRVTLERWVGISLSALATLTALFGLIQFSQNGSVFWTH
jgi:hypothetical protein